MAEAQSMEQNISALPWGASAENPPQKRMKITPDAMLAKRTAHKENTKKKEEAITNELSKQKYPSQPWAVSLPPKTEAEKILEKKLNEAEKSKLRLQVLELKVKLKQENPAPMLALTTEDETDVDSNIEPPPCPVHLML